MFGYYNKGLLLLKLIINNHKVCAVVDSGAEISTMSLNMAKSLKIDNKINKEASEYITSGGIGGNAETVGILEDIPVTGQEHTDQVFDINFTVIKMNDNLILLGMNFLNRYDGIINVPKLIITLEGKNYYLEIGSPYNEPEEIKSKNTKNKESNMNDFIKSILEQIIKNPTVERYRKINKYSPAVLQKVNDIETFFERMIQIGFVEVDNKMIYVGDAKNLLFFMTRI